MSQGHKLKSVQAIAHRHKSFFAFAECVLLTGGPETTPPEELKRAETFHPHLLVSSSESESYVYQIRKITLSF